MSSEAFGPDAFRARVAETSRLGPVVIAEVAQSHDGSLGQAHSFIDAVASTGAEAIKFQTHIARAESTRREPWRVTFSKQDATRYGYWERMEFTEEQWEGLRAHASDAGVFFLSSSFSGESFALLQRVGVAAWKVASGEVSNEAAIRSMARTGRLVILSSGLSSWEELSRAVSWVRDEGGDPIVLQCTTAYPTTPDQVGLNVLAEMRERLGVVVGLSDHSATPFPGLAAAALGASVVEVHVTLSPWMFGPDVPASLDLTDLTTLASGCRAIGQMLASPIDKDAPAPGRGELRSMFSRSLVAARDLPAGTVLSADDLRAKKPGGGVAPEDIDLVLGAILVEAVEFDEEIRLEGVIRESP